MEVTIIHASPDAAAYIRHCVDMLRTHEGAAGHVAALSPVLRSTGWTPDGRILDYPWPHFVMGMHKSDILDDPLYTTVLVAGVFLITTRDAAEELSRKGLVLQRTLGPGADVVASEVLLAGE